MCDGMCCLCSCCDPASLFRAHPPHHQHHLGGLAVRTLGTTSQPITHSWEIQFLRHTRMICTLTQGSILPHELYLKLKKRTENVFHNGGRTEQNIRMLGRAAVGKTLLMCEYFQSTVEQNSPDLFVIPFPVA